MKTILALLLALTGLAAPAAPKFLPLPGTPEGDALATNAAAVPAPAVTNPAPVVPVTPLPAAAAPMVAPAAPGDNPAARLQTAVPGVPAPPTRTIPQRRQNLPAMPAMPAPGTAPAPAPAVAPGTTPAAAPAAGTAKLLAANPDDMMPAGTIQFQATPLEQVLDIYAKLVNRTILRPATLPAAAITIKTQTELTKAEALQALDSVLGMNGITMIPIGTKFVKAVPVAEANQAGATINESQADVALPELGGYLTHVVQLKYAKPSEVMPVLAPFAKIQGNITALDANGILIIRDYTENVKRMLELIAKIDVTVPSEFISEVIPIKYALASDIASALNSVGGTASGSIGGSGATGGTGAGVTGRSGSTTGNRSFGNTGGAQTVGANRMGSTSPYGGATPGAAAGAQPQTFSQRLQGIISRAATGGGGDFQLIGPNKIIPDERTNSLLVFASRQDMDMIKDIISKLDVVLAQVLIEAIILDVTLGNTFDFGVSAGQQPYGTSGVQGGGFMNGTGGINTGIGFLNNLIQSSTTTSNAGLGTFTTNITYSPNPNKSFPSSSANGLSYFGNIGPTWNVAVTALAAKSNVKVLARPSIQTSQNAPAQIFVGETRPYITGTYNNGYNGGNTSQYQQSQIGISLNVTPLINPDGLVVMDIQQQVQQASPKGGGVMIDGNEVPITQDQNASCKVAVRNGETIVMGGFIQNIKSAGKTGIPFLQDIPLLGYLFRSTSTSDSRRELLVMIRPTVLPNPGDAALHTQVELDRHPTLKEANADFQKSEDKLLKHANKAVKPDTSKKPSDKDTDTDTSL